MFYSIKKVIDIGDNIGGNIIINGGEVIYNDEIVAQNLKFETKDSYLQVPNTGFIISKYVILEILNVINKSYAEDKIPDFDKIKIFNFPNNEIDKIFNFTGLKPNF